MIIYCRLIQVPAFRVWRPFSVIFCCGSFVDSHLTEHLWGSFWWFFSLKIHNYNETIINFFVSLFRSSLWNETQERHFLVFWTGFWKYVWLDFIKTSKHKRSIAAFKSQHYLTLNILQQLHSSHSTVPLLLWSFLVTEAEFSLRGPVQFDSVHIYIYLNWVPKSCWCSCRARMYMTQRTFLFLSQHPLLLFLLCIDIFWTSTSHSGTRSEGATDPWHEPQAQFSDLFSRNQYGFHPPVLGSACFANKKFKNVGPFCFFFLFICVNLT